MNTMRSWLIVIITVLMLVALSCKGLSAGQDVVLDEVTEVVATIPMSNVDTVTPIPTDEPPEVTEAPPLTETSQSLSVTEASQPTLATLPTLSPAQPGPDSLDLAQLPEDHGLSDFTEDISANMNWTDDEGEEQQSYLLFSHRQQSVPAFAWYSLYDDQNIFFPTTVETVLVDGQGFSTSTDNVGCNTLSKDQINLDEQRLGFIELIGALTGEVSKAEADIDLDELTVDVYYLEAANLTPGAEVELEGKYIDSDGGSSSTSTTLTLNDEDIEFESGRLFLAQQGGFVARIELLYSKIAGDEDSLFAQVGTRIERMMVYEVLPTTASDDAIIPPAGCEAATDDGGLEDGDDSSSGGNLTIADMPRIADTSNVVETGENLIYSTNSSLDDVVDFYKSELSALDWELSDEFSAGMVATLEFNHGNQTILISIVDAGDGALVTIDLY